MKLRETFLHRIKEVKGRAIDFRIDQVRLPNEKTATREYLNHPGAVGVIALLGKNSAILVRQYRYPVKGITLEVPAGKLDLGESPLKCAARELEEETGYRAGRIKKLLSFWPTAAFANEVIHIFVADKLTKGSLRPDEDEFIQGEVWPLPKIYRAIDQGRIKDAKTIIALLAYKFRSQK